jgi:hypothetical protein
MICSKTEKYSYKMINAEYIYTFLYFYYLNLIYIK